jgi:threonine dehydratase
MYDSAPEPKLEGVRRLGAEPVLMPRPDVLDWMAREGWRGEPEAFIHPFLGDELQAGHGGAGLEIAAQVPAVERVVVPVGGGGLVSGIAAALAAVRPGLEVVGVQSDGYPLWPRALAAGGPVELSPETIADGTTAPYTAEMRARLRRAVSRWVVVPEPRLRAAVAELTAVGRVVAEGAGALAFAALEQLEPGPVTVVVISGGNLDRRLLAELLG